MREILYAEAAREGRRAPLTRARWVRTSVCTVERSSTGVRRTGTLISCWSPLAVQLRFSDRPSHRLFPLSRKSGPTLRFWHRALRWSFGAKAHPAARIDRAHYETSRTTDKEVDYARLNRWCGAAVDRTPDGLTRAALFYIPSPSPVRSPRAPCRAGPCASRINAVSMRSGTKSSKRK